VFVLSTSGLIDPLTGPRRLAPALRPLNPRDFRDLEGLDLYSAA
jgi:hypothetical protein